MRTLLVITIVLLAIAKAEKTKKPEKRSSLFFDSANGFPSGSIITPAISYDSASGLISQDSGSPGFGSLGTIFPVGGSFGSGSNPIYPSGGNFGSSNGPIIPSVGSFGPISGSIFPTFGSNGGSAGSAVDLNSVSTVQSFR
ncbi:hypothetical protein JTB14_030530 [Gonioctena quinquepunctata]|nr:hypothetical protein JTB14_030530 [Gonioctena quinquepunctata]